MKKFLISFDYSGFLFSAKVIVKRDNRKMEVLTTVINNELAFFLDGNLMFMEDRNGFQLLLFKRDRTFESLHWEIKLEYFDKTEMVNKEAFSLS